MSGSSSEAPREEATQGPGGNEASRRPLSRLEVLRALRISNLEAITATVHTSLTGGAFQTGFALWLGAGSLWIGVIGALPTFAALVQMPSSIWIERLGERRRVTAWFSLLSRSMWLPILLVSWLHPEVLRLPVFLILFALSCLALQVPIPAFTSWLSDLVPADHRGRYFGRRNMLAGLTALVSTLPAAWLLDRGIEQGAVSQGHGLSMLFAIAVVFGIVNFVLLMRQPEPPMAMSPSPESSGLVGTLSLYRSVIDREPFRQLLLFSAIFSIGQFFAAPFYTVYAIEDLHLSYMWLQALGGAASLSALVAMPLWGYLGDKFGNKPLLAIAVIGVSLTPLPWLLASPSRPEITLVILILNNLFGGAVWAGVGLLQFNMVIETTPASGRGLYVGALSAATGVAGGLAPIVGGICLEWLRSSSGMSVGIPVHGYHALFLANALIRILTLPLLQRIPSRDLRTPREVIGQLGTVRMNTLRHLRRLQKGTSETERHEAAAALSAIRSPLPVLELAQALNDPSLKVRRSAAIALGEIGDPVAVAPLLEAVSLPECDVRLEALDALGRLGAEEAVIPIARILQSGDDLDRLSAARALGRIARPEADAYLLAGLEDAMTSENYELATVLVQALGACGSKGAISALLGLLPNGPRSLRLAAAQALGEIGDRSACPTLGAALLAAEDYIVQARTAVALAECGCIEALPSIYQALDTLEVASLRREVAAAIGSLLQDSELYRWLSSDPMVRDEGIARRLRLIGRPRKTTPIATSVRRRPFADRALQAYGEGDLIGAARLVIGGYSGEPGPISDMIALASKRLRTDAITEEAFLTLIAAVTPRDVRGINP